MIGKLGCAAVYHARDGEGDLRTERRDMETWVVDDYLLFSTGGVLNDVEVIRL